MKKLGIMGGTFNPVHNAHLLIAETAREQYGLERVILLRTEIRRTSTAMFPPKNAFT